MEQLWAAASSLGPISLFRPGFEFHGSDRAATRSSRAGQRAEGGPEAGPTHSRGPTAKKKKKRADEGCLSTCLPSWPSCQPGLIDSQLGGICELQPEVISTGSLDLALMKEPQTCPIVMCLTGECQQAVTWSYPGCPYQSRPTMGLTPEARCCWASEVGLRGSQGHLRA